MIDKTTYLLT